MQHSFCDLIMQLDSAGNLARPEAPGAGVDMARSSVDHGLDALDVRFPHSVRTAMGMGDLNTESYALSADIALCHSIQPPSGRIHRLSAGN